MLPYFTEDFGNPASRQHAFGWKAHEAVDRARSEIAALIGASGGEIVFTSGASESNNLAIKGVAQSCRDKGDHLVTVATEHKSVLDSFKRLESEGWRVTRLGVDGDGFIRLDELRDAVTDKTVLVSVMAANNEIGVLQPLAEIGAIASARGALLHTDAAQAAGKVPIDVNAMGIDLLSLTGHKYYGPEGRGRALHPPQEAAHSARVSDRRRRPRAGVPLRHAQRPRHRRTRPCRGDLPQRDGGRIGAARRRCAIGCSRGCAPSIDGVRVNGSLARRLPHNLHVSIDRVEGESLLMALGDLAVSTGSACSSGSQAPSHVLQAIGAVGESGAVDPLRPRPPDHGRRHRLRDRARHDGRQEPAPRAGRDVNLMNLEP